MISHLDRIENIVETGENTGNRKCWLPVFSPLPTLFAKPYFPGVVKTWLQNKYE